MFSIMVVGNSVMCWSTIAIDERKWLNLQSGMGAPDHVISPDVGSAKRSKSRTSVVFPAPVEPTTPVVCPASNSRLRLEKTLSRSG